MHHFRDFCEGGSFQLWADHKPLVTALIHVSVPISPRQQCHLAFISEFNVEMLYLPGLKNVAPIFLSCPSPSPPRSAETVTASAAADPVNFEAMAAKQTAAQKHSACSVAHPSNWLSAHQVPNASLAMFQQAFLPHCSPKFRKDIFFYFFPQISHPGRLASQHMVSSRFVWRGLASDITTWSRACLHCQQAKIHHHMRMQPQPVAIPQRRFSHHHIDLVGPLQYIGGFNLFSLSMITHPIGWMQFPYLIRPWRHALKL
jgi:hypothetical protein